MYLCLLDYASHIDCNIMFKGMFYRLVVTFIYNAGQFWSFAHLQRKQLKVLIRIKYCVVFSFMKRETGRPMILG